MKKAKSITDLKELADYRLTPEALARQLKAETGTDYANKIQQAMDAGAPVEPDGTVPVAKFVAWLIEHR